MDGEALIISLKKKNEDLILENKAIKENMESIRDDLASADRKHQDLLVLHKQEMLKNDFITRRMKLKMKRLRKKTERMERRRRKNPILSQMCLFRKLSSGYLREMNKVSWNYRLHKACCVK
mmetsp:Transcript_21782/g.36702  ORF Transcript_21782/g.36702 Transcript_21782/m.36702 type:complete len:121 (+) Transcript_21782:173-535(+)